MVTWRAAPVSLLLACSSTAMTVPDGGPLPDGPPPVNLDAPYAPFADAPAASDLGPDVATCAVPPDTYGPFANCKAGGTQPCDLVCQARCGCGQRCMIEAGGLDSVAGCRDQAGPFQGLGETCDPKNDHCRPGTLCLQEAAFRPDCGAHCYRHCRSDNDCMEGAQCAIELLFAAATSVERLCTLPGGCDPFGEARCPDAAQRPYPTFGCYVMSTSQPNLTICACAGTVPVGMPCTYEHECVPGAECVATGTLPALCRQICAANAVAGSNRAPCPNGQACTAFSGSTKYGFCHS